MYAFILNNLCKAVMLHLLLLEKVRVFTSCIDRGVVVYSGVERVTHSGICDGQLEVFVTARQPLPPTTNMRVTYEGSTTPKPYRSTVS